MRTYDEALQVARDRAPFANGTEGEAWMGNYCHQCRHDDGADGCPLLFVALMGSTPLEWTPNRPDSLGHQYTCTEFQARAGEATPLVPPGAGEVSVVSVVWPTDRGQ
jgi:hypothetical protein